MWFHRSSAAQNQQTMALSRPSEAAGYRQGDGLAVGAPVVRLPPGYDWQKAMENLHTKWWFIAGKIIYQWAIYTMANC